MKNKMLSIVICVMIMTVPLFGLSACNSDNLNRYEAETLDFFDTSIRVIGYAESDEMFQEILAYVYEDIKDYHQLSDIYNSYEGLNNLKTINDNAGIAPIKVDKKLIDMLLFCKEIYKLTDGKVNIAFGSVLNIWHDYREEALATPENASIPQMDILLQANEHTNIDNLVINEEEGTVYLQDKDMRLDVGAIAKGYAAEQVALDFKKEFNNRPLLLSMGGNVRAVGYKKNNDVPWEVGVQNPDTQSDESILLSVGLANKSLVTSGDYQRFYLYEGKRYHHIIDPVTLMPSDYYLSVTILTENSGLADGLSTAAFILPLEKAKALIESIDNTEAVFVLKDGTLEYTDGFQDYIIK